MRVGAQTAAARASRGSVRTRTGNGLAVRDDFRNGVVLGMVPVGLREFFRLRTQTRVVEQGCDVFVNRGAWAVVVTHESGPELFYPHRNHCLLRVRWQQQHGFAGSEQRGGSADPRMTDRGIAL